MYDSTGKLVRLRGINRTTLESVATGDHLSLADYQNMKNWGTNVIRLTLSQCFWLSTQLGYNSAYLGVIDTQEANIKSLGMAVIIDLHWNDKGNSSGRCALQLMPDSNSAIFWQQVCIFFHQIIKIYPN